MYKVIDLFSGAGGLSYGFDSNKSFKIVAAVENNKHAKETYKANHKDDLELLSDIKDVDYNLLNEKFGEVDVVIGGPPCQGFSNANRQKTGIINTNNGLVKEYFKAIKSLKPKFFVMENVKMLKSEKHRFFYSRNDKNEIDSFNIELREENIVISEQNIFRFDISLIAEKQSYREYMINKSLFKLLNTLSKKRRDEAKVRKFLCKNSKALLRLMESEHDSYFKPEFEVFTRAIESQTYSSYFFEILEQFINFEESIKIIEEIETNRLIGNYKQIDNLLVAKVYSYSVIEYIDKILGENYNQFRNVVNAINFGVPQKRQRFILIGVRKDIPYNDISNFFEYKENKTFTVRDAIEDLEGLPVSLVADVQNKGINRVEMTQRNDYRHYICDSELIYNHIATKSTPTALKRFKLLREGQNFHDLSQEMKSTYTTPERTQNTIYLRIEYDKPSGTVVNVRKSMWIHPKKDRAISVREAARLQSFPDSFIFKGTKDSQYQQIGNAVPPKISQVLAKKIENLLVMGGEMSD